MCFTRCSNCYTETYKPRLLKSPTDRKHYHKSIVQLCPFCIDSAIRHGWKHLSQEEAELHQIQLNLFGDNYEDVTNTQLT